MAQDEFEQTSPLEEAAAAEPAQAVVPAGAPPVGPAARPRRPPTQFRRRRRHCPFCADKARRIDYKDVSGLRQFLTDRGRIEARRKLGTCAKHQRALAVALKRARHLALLPATPEQIRISGFFTWRP